jgi:hypothetical protein
LFWNGFFLPYIFFVCDGVAPCSRAIACTQLPRVHLCIREYVIHRSNSSPWQTSERLKDAYTWIRGKTERPTNYGDTWQSGDAEARLYKLGRAINFLIRR